MRVHRRLLSLLLACSIAGPSLGCASFKAIDPVAAPAPAFSTIKAGDTVVVHTRDGRIARFKVQRVDRNAIIAEDGSTYTRDDIARIERRSFSGARTTLLVGGIVGGLALVLVAAAAAALSSLGG